MKLIIRDIQMSFGHDKIFRGYPAKGYGEKLQNSYTFNEFIESRDMARS